MPEPDILQMQADSKPPWIVAMHVHIRFVHEVTEAENMDAATQLVRSKVDMFLNKARAEAGREGIDMRCDYLVTY